MKLKIHLTESEVKEALILYVEGIMPGVKLELDDLLIKEFSSDSFVTLLLKEKEPGPVLAPIQRVYPVQDPVDPNLTHIVVDVPSADKIPL